jgi:mono/diheme cytochrome c family protein
VRAAFPLTAAILILAGAAALAQDPQTPRDAAAPAPVGTPQPVTRQLRSGEAIYRDRCIYCHDRGGWATRVLAKRVPAGEAPLIDRKELPADYTRQVVRRGIGSMPAFTPTDLSDREVAIIADWLDKSQ